MWCSLFFSSLDGWYGGTGSCITRGAEPTYNRSGMLFRFAPFGGVMSFSLILQNLSKSPAGADQLGLVDKERVDVLSAIDSHSVVDCCFDKLINAFAVPFRT